MTGRQLVIDVRDTSTIIVVGEIDAHSVGEFRAAIDGLGPNQRIDLSGCTFLDSSGIACLINAKTSTEKRNGSITLVAPSHPVRRLLTISGLDDTFAIEDDAPTDGPAA